MGPATDTSPRTSTEEHQGGLIVEHVSKTFPSQVALDDVSLTIVSGEVHGLLGQNGSGKSTLIKVLAGYHAPDPGGSVTVDGVTMGFGDPDESRRVGLRFVHQNLGVIDQLNVVENVALASGYTKRGRRFIDWRAQTAKTERLLAKLGVDIDVRTPLGECRAVERSAVAIARALDDEEAPIRYLVLDEPTAALPPNEVERLFELIAEVRSHDIGVVYVSHRLDEIDRLAQRISVLRDGLLVGAFDATELDRGQLIEVIVGHPVEETSGPVGRAPAADGTESPRADEDPNGSTTGEDWALEVTGLRSATVEGASFSVRRGEILGLAGLVGSGRDEAMYALTGAVPSSIDGLRVNGTELDGLDPRRAVQVGVALVPGNRQRGSAVFAFDVRENTSLPSLRRYRNGLFVSKDRESAAAQSWVERLDVQPPRLDRTFAELSGGNQQKVIIGKWLNTDPHVVLLDEPTAGVDIGAREAIYQLVREHAAGGLAFVVSSSDVDDLAALCDRVVTFHEGVITTELIGHEITEEALLHSMMGEPATVASTARTTTTSPSTTTPGKP